MKYFFYNPIALKFEIVLDSRLSSKFLRKKLNNNFYGSETRNIEINENFL